MVTESRVSGCLEHGEKKRGSGEIQTLRRIYARVLRTTGVFVIKTCYSRVLKALLSTSLRLTVIIKHALRNRHKF